MCVKKDFDDLYNSIVDSERQLTVVHGGVVEVAYRPVTTAKDLTLVHPYSTPLPDKQEPAAAQPEEEAALAQDAGQQEVCNFDVVCPPAANKFSLLGRLAESHKGVFRNFYFRGEKHFLYVIKIEYLF